MRSRDDAAILRALVDPANRGKTVTQICVDAKISRTAWYRRRACPSFRLRFNAACIEALADDLGPVFDALGRSALLEGRDGHGDRKLFLEVAGLYTPGSRVSVSTDAADANKGDVMSDEALLAAFAGRESLLPPGVRRRIGKDPDSPAGKAA